MKELEKVKNISIASTLFILAIIIGLLTYKRPKNTFTFNTKTNFLLTIIKKNVVLCCYQKSICHVSFKVCKMYADKTTPICFNDFQGSAMFLEGFRGWEDN